MKTAYYANKVLDHLTKVATYTAPTTLYIALFTDEPGRIAPYLNELTGYTRQALSFGAASNGVAANSAGISFGTLPDATIRYWGIYDASTNGNLLEYFKMPSEWVVGSGLAADVNVGNLLLREA